MEHKISKFKVDVPLVSRDAAGKFGHDMRNAREANLDEPEFGHDGLEFSPRLKKKCPSPN